MNEVDETVPHKRLPVLAIPAEILSPPSSAPRSSPAADPLFDEFWSVYPRKVGKGMARREWGRMTNRKVGVNPQRVVAAAARFRDECRAKGTDAKYIPHPGNWLRNGRYEDEAPGPEPVAALTAPPPQRREWQVDEQLIAAVVRLADPDHPLSSAEAIVRAIRAQFPAGIPEGFPFVSAERGAELAGMRYADYLLTPEWQQRRKAMLKSAGYRCMVCNRDSMLNVHHRTYERRGTEHPSDLIVLCEECHLLFHGKGHLHLPVENEVA